MVYERKPGERYFVKEILVPGRRGCIVTNGRHIDHLLPVGHPKIHDHYYTTLSY